MARYAKLDAEMRAQRKGLQEVTTAIVRETEQGYVQTFGAEAGADHTGHGRGERRGAAG